MVSGYSEPLRVHQRTAGQQEEAKVSVQACTRNVSSSSSSSSSSCSTRGPFPRCSSSLCSLLLITTSVVCCYFAFVFARLDISYFISVLTLSTLNARTSTSGTKSSLLTLYYLYRSIFHCFKFCIFE